MHLEAHVNPGRSRGVAQSVVYQVVQQGAQGIWVACQGGLITLHQAQIGVAGIGQRRHRDHRLANELVQLNRAQFGSPGVWFEPGEQQQLRSHVDGPFDAGVEIVQGGVALTSRRLAGELGLQLDGSQRGVEFMRCIRQKLALACQQLVKLGEQLVEGRGQRCDLDGQVGGVECMKF